MTTITAVLAARRTIRLRPRREVAAEIEDAVSRLELKGDLADVERFAARAGRIAAAQLRQARTEAQLATLALRWARISLRESVDSRRAVVSRLGAAILSAAPGGEE